MTFEQWAESVSMAIRGDRIWRMEAYRLALFLFHLAWPDATKLIQDPRTVGVADQLYRSAGSISANLTEGYSRGTGPDRARFYEYALGSARETRDWYYKASPILGQAVFTHRTDVIMRLTLTMVPEQRKRKTRLVPQS